MLCELMRHVSCHEVDVFVMWRNVCDVAVEACSSLCSIGTIASRLEAIASKGLRVQFVSLSPCSANCPPKQSNCSTLPTTTLKKAQRKDDFAVGCIFLCNQWKQRSAFSEFCLCSGGSHYSGWCGHQQNRFARSSREGTLMRFVRFHGQVAPLCSAV